MIAPPRLFVLFHVTCVIWIGICGVFKVDRPGHRKVNATDKNGMPFTIRTLTPDDLDAAVALLGRGMLNNPLHIAVFGGDPVLRERRLSRLFTRLVGFIMRRGTVFGAYVDGALIGVVGMIEPKRCRPGVVDLMRFAHAIILGQAPVVALRILRWLVVWAYHDPADPHWHIGPLAVDIAYRGQGVGRRLMAECCNRIDAQLGTGYLETDLAVNVTFYQSLGFAMVKQIRVLGVPNWLMQRPPLS